MKKGEMTDMSKTSSLRQRRLKYGKPYEYEPNYIGFEKDRKCTDIFCLFFFLGFVVTWIVLGVFAIQKGDPEKIFYPTNNKGELCGRGKHAERRYLLYFDITRCLSDNVLYYGCPTTQMCVKSCPTNVYAVYNELGNSSEISVKWHIVDYCLQMPDKDWNTMKVPRLLRLEYCPTYIVPSVPTYFICLPYFEGEKLKEFKDRMVIDTEINPISINGETLIKSYTNLELFLSSKAPVEQFFNHMYSTWGVFFVAIICSAVTSFLFILALPLATKEIVWLSIVIMVILFIAIVSLIMATFYMNYETILTVDNIFKIYFTQDFAGAFLGLKWMQILLMFVFISLTLILVASVILLRRQIKVSILLISAMRDALYQRLHTIFFPFLTLILEAICISWLAVNLLYWQSVSNSVFKIVPMNIESQEGFGAGCRCINPDTSIGFKLGDRCHLKFFQKNCKMLCPNFACQFISFEISTFTMLISLFNIFAFYWITKYLVGYSKMVLAGVFSTWYWSREKKNFPSSSIFLFMMNTWIYHSGTIAYGSALICLLKIPRILTSQILEFALRHGDFTKKLVLSLCRCSFECYDVFVKFISGDAYVMCTLKGKNLVLSGTDAYNLCKRNIKRVYVSNTCVDFSLFFPKLMIVLLSTLISFWVLRLKLEYFGIMPVIVTFIGCYITTTLFFVVPCTAADTLFFCILEDVERNDGTKYKPYAMPELISTIIPKIKLIMVPPPRIQPHRVAEPDKEITSIFMRNAYETSPADMPHIY